MLSVGLTGGIGSGKSSVADLFSQLDVPVIDADVIAHQLTAPGSETLALIIKTFGSSYLTQNGELDRKKLASYVFTDETARLQLEKILHPRVRLEMKQQFAKLEAPYAILVIPLLFETGFTDLVDRVLVVDASDDERIKRVMQRDQRSREQIEAIMAQQLDRDSRLAGADDVLNNQLTLAELSQTVHGLHNRYLQLAKQNT